MRLTRLSLALLLALASPVHAERLSAWLLSRPQDPEAYPLGLVWATPSEKLPQNEIYYDLLDALQRHAVGNPQAARRMRGWIASMRVTGRVPLASGDALWLATHPDRDPVISSGDTVFMPHRPETVTVVKSDGTLCRVRHAQGYFAIDYANRCGAKSVDWVYVAQPDGKSMRYGTGLWNQEKELEPAPGAWIWAPEAGDGWTDEFSRKLIVFLSTQGVAADSNHALPPPHRSQILSALFPYQDLPVTANDWGEAGLLQTPTARMRELSDFSFTISRVYPYTRGNLFFQPFEWMEAGFRYTNISNRLYGPVSFSGSQAYKDKSIDVKFRLLKESAWLPEFSFGFRDIAGTGLFSGEYAVGSKRTGPFDWSLGLGWGYVGNRADLGNPIGRLFPSFNVRSALSNSLTQTGSFALSSYFHGPTALFGGVQYQTPWDPLILKLEYDGNDYKNDPLGNVLPQSSPFNFGATYRLSDWIDLTAGVERGNTAMFSLSMHRALKALYVPKLDDPPRVPVKPAAPTNPPDWKKTIADIDKQTQWHVARIARRRDELRLTVDDPNVVYWRDYLDRAVSVLHRDAPSDVKRFALVYRQDGVKVGEHLVDRNEWVAERTRLIAPMQKKAEVVALPPEKNVKESLVFKKDPDAFESHVGMNINYNLGGPNGFILYQFAPSWTAQLHFDRNTWLQGNIQYDILDNYSKFTYDAPSNLPRVRTYLREYTVTSRLTMPNLQLSHVGKLTDNQYWSVYGGYLEPMFAGAGGEWLYRPFLSKLAFGVNLNEVQQRDFAQNFRLRDYRVLTGHGTLYWDTGWKDVIGTLSFGRYLAGDIGATIDFSRVFDNGVAVGAFFTRTNVSAAQFGEGSFDKGVYVSIPLDAFLTRSSHDTAGIMWKPLTRDGGAMLERQVSLYALTEARNPRTLDFKPAPLPDNQLMPEDHAHKDLVPIGPLPELKAVPQPSADIWHGDSSRYAQRMRDALYFRGFRNIAVSFDASSRLSLSLSSGNIRPMSRAVGVAARIALLNAPLDTREVSVACDNKVVYDFTDADKLKRYFSGAISLGELRKYVVVRNLDPSYQEADQFGKLAKVELSDKKPALTEALLHGMHPVDRVETDIVNAAKIASQTDWLKTGAIGAGLILGSSLLDKPANTFALKHASNSLLRNFDAFGNALPWVESAGAALSALGSSDPELSRTGYAASEAAVTSFGLVLGLKTVVGRARPYTGQSSHSFYPFSGSATNGTDGFPSGHSIVAWSVLTPFAEEYHMPWLYGVAALTNLSRVGSRNHWVSDTVAGSFLGYGIGKYFWEASKMNDGPHVFLSPYGVDLSWDMP